MRERGRDLTLTRDYAALPGESRSLYAKKGMQVKPQVISVTTRFLFHNFVMLTLQINEQIFCRKDSEMANISARSGRNIINRAHITGYPLPDLGSSRSCKFKSSAGQNQHE